MTTIKSPDRVVKKIQIKSQYHGPFLSLTLPRKSSFHLSLKRYDVTTRYGFSTLHTRTTSLRVTSSVDDTYIIEAVSLLYKKFQKVRKST